MDSIASFWLAICLELFFAQVPPDKSDGIDHPPRIRDRLHPIYLLGSLASLLERVCFHFYQNAIVSRPTVGRILGGLAVCVLMAVVGMIVWLWFDLRGKLWGLGTSLTTDIVWIVMNGVIMMPFFATRLLNSHVSRIKHDLVEGHIALARRHLRHLVGRNTDNLGQTRILRATCESLAENFSDAVVAPALAAGFCGLPGLIFVKTANLLDSMWGYRSPRYRYFGTAAARFDDVVQFASSRLSALLIIFCAPSRLHNLRLVKRYAPRHASLNAGWPESAMAVVLGVRFGGRVSYPNSGKGTKTLWLGNRSRRMTIRNCESAQKLYWGATGLLLGLIAIFHVVLVLF